MKTYLLKIFPSKSGEKILLCKTLKNLHVPYERKLEITWRNWKLTQTWIDIYIWKTTWKVQVIIYKAVAFFLKPKSNPVDWSCKIWWLHLCRGVDPYHHQWLSWIMTLNHLIVKLQSWSFGECGVLLHCHYS